MMAGLPTPVFTIRYCSTASTTAVDAMIRKATTALILAIIRL
jgi:hypothetical protein